jgi:hypothetical protein
LLAAARNQRTRGTAASCLLELFPPLSGELPEDEWENAEAARFAGAMLLVDAFDELRMLREALTKKAT